MESYRSLCFQFCPREGVFCILPCSGEDNRLLRRRSLHSKPREEEGDMEADHIPAFPCLLPNWHFFQCISCISGLGTWALSAFGDSGCPLCSQRLIIHCNGHIYSIAGVNNLIYSTLNFLKFSLAFSVHSRLPGAFLCGSIALWHSSGGTRRFLINT